MIEQEQSKGTNFQKLLIAIEDIHRNTEQTRGFKASLRRGWGNGYLEKLCCHEQSI